MRLVINILLLGLAIFLVYALAQSIKEPIAFNSERTHREGVVVDKLKDIRTAQDLFRSIKGGFAPNFDTLQQVLTNDSFQIIKILGDPDDPNFDKNDIIRDTTLLPAKDSIRSLGIMLDSLRYVPFGNGKKFTIVADTITYQATSGVDVVEVGTTYKVFMGKYGDKKYARYDQSYDPNNRVKFGDLNKPTLAGSWDK